MISIVCVFMLVIQNVTSEIVHAGYNIPIKKRGKRGTSLILLVIYVSLIWYYVVQIQIVFVLNVVSIY